jgi:hypothetical protein
MKVPYREGTWFAVPLRDSGFGVGVVARSTKQGCLLCYFFGPRRDLPPSISDVAALSASDAIMVQMVGDLGLIRGEWPILGEPPIWDRSKWPVPPFVRRDPILGQARRVQYSEHDLFTIIKEGPEPNDSKLESDGSLGYGAAEILLTKRLNRLSRNE